MTDPTTAPARRGRRVGLLGVVAGLVALVALPGVASAAPAAPAQQAVIRAAHFSPTTPGVDVYLTAFSGGPSTLWLSGVGYGAVSPYQDITAGLYTVAMRPHGASASTRPMLSWTLDARAGQAYTAAGVGSGSSVRGVVIRDDLSTPPRGEGRVRVIQAASRAPSVTVRAADGPVIARDAAFAQTTGYATVPAGTWAVTAASDSGVRTSGDVKVAAGTVSSVLLLDAKGTGITLRTVLDASSASTVPRGSVPAGGGGMAGVLAPAHPGGHGWSTGIAAFAALGVALILVACAAGGRSVGRRRPAHARRGLLSRLTRTCAGA